MPQPVAGQGGGRNAEKAEDTEKSVNAETAEEQRDAEPRVTPAFGRLHGSRGGGNHKRTEGARRL